MKKYSLLTKVMILYLSIIFSALAERTSFFEQGELLFSKKKYNESKVFFEKDIVFNPKSEISYLYLAKIFKEENDLESQETNLNSVLLLNPKNEDAVYMLILIKIEQSDYFETEKLIKKFNLVCKSFCNKKDELNKKFNKLIPENAK
jgi:tetratricopeptide (TPR) repeat protein